MSSVLHSLRINSLYKKHGTTYPFTKLIPLLCEERYLTRDLSVQGWTTGTVLHVSDIGRERLTRKKLPKEASRTSVN